MKRLARWLLCLSLLVPNSASAAAEQTNLQLDRSFLPYAGQGKLPGISVAVGDTREQVHARWGEPNEAVRYPDYLVDRYDACGVAYVANRVDVLNCMNDSSGTKWTQMEGILGKPDYEGYEDFDIVRIYQAGDYEAMFVRESGVPDPGIASVHLSKSVVRSKDRIHVLVFGKEVEFDQPPVIVKGRTLVPMRAIIEALGYDVEWNANTETAKVSTLSGSGLMFKLGSKTISQNGSSIEAEVAPQLVNGRMMVPVRVIAESLNSDVRWDEYENAIYIAEHPERVIGLPAPVPAHDLGWGSETAFRVIAVESRQDATYFKIRITNTLDHALQVSWPDTVFLVDGKMHYHPLSGSKWLDAAWTTPVQPGETREGFVAMTPSVPLGAQGVLVSVGLLTGSEDYPVAHGDVHVSLKGVTRQSSNSSPIGHSVPVYHPVPPVTAPAASGDTLPVKQTQGDVSITVTDVVNRDAQTFFHVRVENNRSQETYLFPGLSEMLVNGQRFIHLGSNLDPNLQSSLSPGEVRDGYIAIPANLNGAKQVIFKTKVYGESELFTFEIAL